MFPLILLASHFWKEKFSPLLHTALILVPQIDQFVHCILPHPPSQCNKDASRTFWNMLKDGLEARGYESQSKSDACVFFGKDSIILVYVDDLVVIQNKNSTATDRLIQNLQGNEAFVFTDDGDLNKYLGVDVDKKKDGSIELTQPHLITRFLEVIGIDDKVNPRPTPAIKPLLHKDIGGLIRKHVWNYRQAIGMANYLFICF